LGIIRKRLKANIMKSPTITPFVTKKCEAILYLFFQSEGETLTPAESPRSGHTIKPKTAMAMHIWEKDRNEFKKKVEVRSETKVILLQAGQEYGLN
jgi:hypothetical protein